MSELLHEIQKKLVFPIDFVSQRQVERLVYRILFFGTSAACLIGFVTQSMFNLLTCFGVSFTLCLIAVLPSYPAFNKQRPEWVKPRIRV
ncbi:LADA_0F10044g1_1 [Lachancea dasiensis]|uniref:LADA_0F10044g1_1 n=1 Tax=Lachancea dasiensis TaxID=1072105 RepID=A0A1G4JLI3_9SACH|nr:LADA_0F10044g1_1 [Lachancea dasiensis]